MNIILLILSLAVFPTVTGCVAVKAYNRIKDRIIKTVSPERESVFCRLSTYFSTGVILLLLVAGVINILAVFINMSVSKASRLFGLVALAILVIAIFISAIYIIIMIKKTPGHSPRGIINPQIIRTLKSESSKRSLTLLTIAAIIFALIQLVYLSANTDITYTGDQTLETVNSFLSTDKIYSVDPLTGLPYLNGYPFRLALQCLPFLYASLANIFSITPSVLVWNIMPVFWLICGYCTIARIADSLFRIVSHKLLCFVIFQFLLWCSDAAIGGTGFNLFHNGSSSVVVLELLIINWSIGTLLSGNRFAVLIAIAAEPLIASTQFGVGVCFFLTFAFILIPRIPIVKRLIITLSEKEGGTDGKA